MKIRRDISAIPARTAEATWAAITALITRTESVDRGQLDSAASMMASIITDEHLKDHPLTIKGVGPRLVIYCRYGTDAVEADAGVDPIDWNPTGGDWTMFVPCDDKNLSWVRNALKTRASRLVVHSLDEHPEDAVEKSEAAGRSAGFEINWGALGRS